MAQNKPNARLFKSLIENECKIYEEYLACLDQERNSITKFNAESVTMLSEKRDQLQFRMKDAQLQRIAMIKDLTGIENTKLTDAVSKHFKGEEASTLLRLAKKLKTLVQKTQTKGHELSYISQFGLNVVNGLYSLFMSATQNVTRSYGRKGKIKESYHPAGSRHSGVIKEA